MMKYLMIHASVVRMPVKKSSVIHLERPKPGSVVIRSSNRVAAVEVVDDHPSARLKDPVCLG